MCLRWRGRRHSTQNPQCEEDNLEALGEFIATEAVGHLAEKRLDENRRRAGEVVSL